VWRAAAEVVDGNILHTEPHGWFWEVSPS
jgi:DNA-directed RNA polymerase subunit E'/Rpb7